MLVDLFIILLFLYNKKNDFAQYMFGKLYIDGIDVSRDIQKVMNYLTMSANQKNPRALYALGIIYYFTLSANQNYADAQIALDQIYMGITRVQYYNINKAIHYFRQASNNNNNIAQYYLGFICLNEGPTINEVRKGISYLKLSAKNGNHDAQTMLGHFYIEGKNIDRDVNEAIRLYKEASCFSIYEAKNNLGVIYKEGYGNVEKNISKKAFKS